MASLDVTPLSTDISFLCFHEKRYMDDIYVPFKNYLSIALIPASK